MPTRSVLYLEKRSARSQYAIRLRHHEQRMFPKVLDDLAAGEHIEAAGLVRPALAFDVARVDPDSHFK
jgi:hypothetical protein